MLSVNKRNIHFIGIGGIGMSAIAEVLLQMGHSVSGSDAADTATTQKLSKLGAKVFKGHLAENVPANSIIVYSSAIREDNPEYALGLKNDYPIMKRAEMLADIMRIKKGLAVAGTHGKTTTSSMLATILEESGLDSTYIIGGIVRNLKGHAKVGKGEYLVAESDESDGSFLLLNPIMSVITNIDDDHMNHYGTMEVLEDAFVQFANQIPFYGVCAINNLDERLRKLKKKIKKPICTFAIENTEGVEADFFAKNIRYAKDRTTYELFIQGKSVGDIVIHIPGEHNVFNSLGAIVLAYHTGISIDLIKSSIAKFERVGRRLESIYTSDKLEVVDDYAHHPTAIMKTIKTARSMCGNKKLVVVFEPHRYTRTKECWSSFLHSFNLADEVYLTPIYAASEKEMDGITSDALARDINRIHPELVKTVDDLSKLKDILKLYKNENVFLLTLGAGAISKKARDYVQEL